MFRLGHQSLWTDELISYELATYAKGAEFWRGLLIDIHGPFNSVLLHGWTRLGTSEAWLRLLYVIPGVLCVPVVWRLGTALFDERVGWLAAVLLAVSPFHVWYSQEVRSYAWAILWNATALLLFVRAWDGKAGRGTWAGARRAVRPLLLTNFSAVFLLAGLSTAVLARRPFSRAFALRWVGVVTFAGLVFLPWFLDWYGRMDAERLFVEAPSPMGVPLRVRLRLLVERDPVPRLGGSPAVTRWALPLRQLHLDRSLRALAPHLPVVALGAAAIAVPLASGLRAARERGAWASLRPWRASRSFSACCSPRAT